jgi:sirohydrochlorin cobaltochelatase
MAGRNLAYLAERISSGAFTIGQVRVESGFSLTHGEDAGRTDLKVFQNPHDAIVIARYDDAGKYRPLKTAPNLAHGWKLQLGSLEAVLLALDFLYPAEVGTAVWQAAGDLQHVSLRETLGRQSGMYAVTRKLSGEQAEALVQGFCRPGCLRRILWTIEGEGATGEAESTEPGTVPLFCAEACNLFVAEARKVVKPAAP